MEYLLNTGSYFTSHLTRTLLILCIPIPDVEKVCDPVQAFRADIGQRDHFGASNTLQCRQMPGFCHPPTTDYP